MENSELHTKLPRIVIAAVALAFFGGALSLAAAAVRTGYVLYAVLPIAAGVTLLRQRAWGGYGFALVALTQLFILPFLFLDSSSIPAGQVWLAAIFNVAVALLFWAAGRSLSRVGAKAGARWPWIALALAFSVPLLFVRAYVTPTESMENTLLIGDRILVRVFPKPAFNQGDLVVFHYPVDPKQIFIKRVIGVAGDRIRMQDRVVYRNGAALTEPYVIRTFPADVHRDNLPSSLDDGALESMPGVLAANSEMLQHHVVNGEVVVPAGNYFVLGDNRDNSLDGRYWGFVKESQVIGKPFLIYDSEAGTGADVVPDASTAQRTRTRWNRVFKLL